MRLLALRKADERTEAGVGPDAESQKVLGAYFQKMLAAGVIHGGETLCPSSQGFRLTIRNGKAEVKEGPFSAPSEVVAAIALLEVKSKEEAIEWIKRWPQCSSEKDGSIEIRELGCAGGVAGIDASNGPDRMGAKRFIVMLMSDEKLDSEVMPPLEILAAMTKRNEEGVKQGILVAGEGLQGSAKGVRVKFSGGKPKVMDGPFAEAKEMVAGFWVLQVDTLQDVITWCESYPYPFGEEAVIEVRQLYKR